MDPRRVNDILRIVGPLTGLINEIIPLMPEGKVKHFLSGFAFALAFLGTRGAGMDYKDVTEAKLVQKLSSMPPPMPPVPPPLGR